MKTQKDTLNEPRRATTLESDIGFGLGAVAGAAAGLVGGPVGMAVGASLGGVIGDVAGTAIHDLEAERTRREHELDDAIGVTGGSIGAPQQLGLVEPPAAATWLRADHDELDARAEAVVAAIEEGDRDEVSRTMSELRERVLEHFAREERELLADYLRAEPADAAALIHDHVELRRTLSELDVAVDLHYLRADAVRALLERLRAHAARENAGLYRWARETGERS